MSSFFFFNDTATTEIYTLSLHDALPISHSPGHGKPWSAGACPPIPRTSPRIRRTPHARRPDAIARRTRSEEHTSELQSHLNLVCRLLLEKKKKRNENKKNQDVCDLTLAI